MLRPLLALIPEQQVGRHLLADEGEHTIDVVRHHWVVYLRPGLQAVLAVLLWIWSLFWRVDVAWLPMIVGLALVLHGAWRALGWHMDLFVVTNMRVFRASGVLSVTTATMPIARILDITVEKPFIGRVLGYGHFVFESAAQAQGLRDIRFIGDPDERDLTIQRVIQRSGLRSSVHRDERGRF